MAESAVRVRPAGERAWAGSPGEPAQTRVGFRCGPDQAWLLLAPGIAAQVAIEPRLTRIPHTQFWFRGVMSLRGSLYPVFDLGAWLTGGLSPVDRVRILVIEPGEWGAAVLISEEPRLVQARRAAPHVAPAERLTEFVKGVFVVDDELAVDFDHRKWFVAVGGEVAGRST